MGRVPGAASVTRESGKVKADTAAPANMAPEPSGPARRVRPDRVCPLQHRGVWALHEAAFRKEAAKQGGIAVLRIALGCGRGRFLFAPFPGCGKNTKRDMHNFKPLFHSERRKRR